MTVFAGNGVAGRHENMASALLTLKAMFWVNWPEPAFLKPL
jgi:hypothetical protein